MSSSQNIATVRSLGDVYEQGTLVTQIKRYANVRNAFVEMYGHEPDFIARSPGRVNLIGEHIDYCGFSVFPMAIDRDIIIAVSANETSRIRVANSNKSKFPARNFDITNPTSGYVDIDPTIHEWSNYFKCGVRGVLDAVKPLKPKGMDCLVDGTIPSGAGLSSSSAFVCCAALATITANGGEFSKKELTEIAIKSERFVGINSGGMDQTASVFAIPNHALHIEFHPNLHPTTVPFPTTTPQLTFVIANTLVVSDKHVSAPYCYNLRVVETRAAALLLARSLGLKGNLETLKEVAESYSASESNTQSESLKAGTAVEMFQHTLEEMLVLVDKYITKKEGYTKSEMADACGLTESEFHVRYMTQYAVKADKFQLFTRARHVYSEALRVYRFRDACEKTVANSGITAGIDVLKELGGLMNESQTSCRDNFNCSCPEIDQLVDACIAAGAFGSRLTGAGWGGCTVSLVEMDALPTFLSKVKKSYYYPRGVTDEAVIGEAFFASRPGGGAVIVNTEL